MPPLVSGFTMTPAWLPFPAKKSISKDVAKHAGVQPSTVSRAINNHPEVSASTRAHVLRSIQELGYVPDRAAKRFRSGKTHSISLILPITSSAFYNRLIDSIDEALEAYDYDAGIFPLLSERRLARYQDASALPYHTDGLVFASLNPDHLYRSPPGRFRGVPAVVLEHPHAPILIMWWSTTNSAVRWPPSICASGPPRRW